MSKYSPQPITVTRFKDGAPYETVQIECTWIVTASRKTIVGDLQVEKRPDGTRVYGGRDFRMRFPTH